MRASEKKSSQFGEKCQNLEEIISTVVELPVFWHCPEDEDGPCGERRKKHQQAGWLSVLRKPEWNPEQPQPLECEGKMPEKTDSKKSEAQLSCTLFQVSVWSQSWACAGQSTSSTGTGERAELLLELLPNKLRWDRVFSSSLNKLIAC